MPTELLACGPVYTLIINQVYALPVGTVRLRAQPITGVLISNDGITFAGPTFDATGQADISAAFIRDTTGGSLVKLGRY